MRSSKTSDRRRSASGARALTAGALCLLGVLAGPPLHALPERQKAVVAEVLTGDTVRLEGGKTLRYIGVQSPPLQSRIPLVRTYGENALAFNRSLVEGKTLDLEWDSRLRDERNNLLAYAYLEDGRFANREVLKAGHGRAVLTAPNLRHAADLRRAELEARRDRAGLWKEEPQNPYLKDEYIGDRTTKTYYLPNSPELERIPQSYLVTFRSRIEARAAGFRACPSCREDAPTEF